MRSCRDCGWCGVVLMVVLWAACGGNGEGMSELGMGPLGSMDSEAPTLTEVTPALGPSTGGTMVTITGDHFASGARVYVAGLEATQVAVLSGTRLTAVIPAHLGTNGPVSLVVKNPDGQQGERGDLFAYYFGRTSFGARTVPQDRDADDMAGADFNGDGKPDLALLNSGYNSVTVLLGDGDDGFESTAYPVLLLGNLLRVMVAGDFNGDGRSDLAIADGTSSGGWVWVLLNDGRGHFNAISGYAVGPSFGASLAVGDFNQDGVSDLVVGHQAGASVLFANGQGGFLPPAPVPVSSPIVFVATGDFDQDGTLDLATCSSGPRYDLSVVLGNGTGGFTSATTIAAQCTSLAVGDFNGDKKLDMITGGFFATPKMKLLLGDGTGRFGAAQKLALDGTWPVAGDFNGDGRLDLTFVNGTVQTMLGSGGGAFLPARAIPNTGQPSHLALGDFDHDKKLDIAILTPSAVHVLQGDGAGGFPSIPSAFGSPSPLAVVAGDWDGDQKPDLAIASSTTNSVALFPGNGNGGFSSTGRSVALSSGPGAMAVGDLNGDKILDIVTTHSGSDSVNVLSGDGKGLFAVIGPFPVGKAPGSVAVGDVNGV